jgi:hypothetical protein
MGFRDLVQEWKEFKQNRRKIVPYTDDMDMVQAINQGHPLFFPWTAWRFIFAFSIPFFFTSVFLQIFFIVYYRILFTELLVNILSISLLCGGLSITAIGISHRQRFMAITAEGIVIPRLLQSHRWLKWSLIQEIRMPANALKIRYHSGIISVSLMFYSNPYLQSPEASFRLFNVLQLYLRTQIHYEDLSETHKRIKREMIQRISKRKKEDSEALQRLIITSAVAGTGWITGWVLGLSIFPQIIIVVCVFIICEFLLVFYWSSDFRRYGLPGIVKVVVIVCVTIIILTIMAAPFFPNPLP